MKLIALPRKNYLATLIAALVFGLLLVGAQDARAASIEPFVGAYDGHLTFEEDGKIVERNMSVEIAQTRKGFNISWASAIRRSDGRFTEKSYAVDFIPSGRPGIFSSAMKSNVFGKQVPLDPLRGEPFVWARIEGDTLTLFSLFIDEAGDYEMLEYHRTLAEGGLDLDFRRIRGGAQVRSIRTLLKRR